MTLKICRNCECTEMYIRLIKGLIYIMLRLFYFFPFIVSVIIDFKNEITIRA